MSAAAGTITLDGLCDLVSTQVDPAMVPESLYVGLEHLAPGRLDRLGGGKASDVQSNKFAFEKNDVLYGKLRPYLDKAVLADESGVCTTELLVLRAKAGVDPRFLACVVHDAAFIEHAMSGVTGAHHPRTSWAHISQFELTKFSTRQQRAIARLLWRLHDLIVACGDSLECAEQLKSKAMRELFTRGLRGESQKETEIGAFPESWNLEPVGAHFSVVSGGTPSRSNAAFWTGGTIPWVKTTEVSYQVITETEERITVAGLENSAAKLLPAGTLLLAMYGQGVTRGKVAVLGIEAACNQACAAMTPKDEAISTRYLYHFLTWRYDAIRALAHGGQQQNLNLDIVRELPVVAPETVEEQDEITSVLEAIDRKIDLHRRKRAALEELFKALLHKLMTGEIRVDQLDLSALETQSPVQELGQ